MKRYALICLAAALIGLFAACKSESTPRSTLELTLEEKEGEKLLAPKEVSLEISRFTVNGSGPDGETFSVTSPTRSVSVSGLLIGSWNVTAEGLNEDGTRLASGKATVQLGPEPSPATIYLDKLEGSGTATIQITWDPNLITDPSFTLEVTNQNTGVTRTQSLDTSTLPSGYVDFETSTLEAGSYMLVGRLYAGGVQVSGFAEALRIVDGQSTSGSINLSLSKTTAIPAKFELVDKIGSPVQCSITGLASEMSTTQQVTAKLEPQPGSEVSTTWYMDGSKVSEGLTCTFTPQRGNHRLDVMAQGSGKASLGSASFTFRGVVTGTRNVPVVVSEQTDGQNQVTAKAGCHIAFLSDGNLIVAGDGYLQVCKIINDELVPAMSYTTGNAPLMPLKSVSDVAVDQSRNLVLIADNVNHALTVYQYHPDDATLSKVTQSDNLVYTGTSEDYVIRQTDRIEVDENRGVAFMGVIDQPQHVYAVAYHTEPVDGFPFRATAPLAGPFNTVTAKDGTVLDGSFDGFDVTANGRLVIAWDNDSNLIVMDDTGSDPTKCYFATQPNSCTYFADSEAARKVHVKDVEILDPDTFVVVHEGGYTLVGQHIQSASSEGTKILETMQDGTMEMAGGGTVEMKGLTRCISDGDGKPFYGLAAGSHNLLVFERSPTNKLFIRGAVQFDDQFTPDELAISPDKKTFVVASSTGPGLKIMAMPE